VSLVANALRRARAEVRSAKRPIAVFLFLGPTGVGKTELAKTIAEAYFGAEDRMVRFDMSEFQDTESIYRLIGKPNEQGTGLLTEAVRQRPFSLVLLDELEKADSSVLNLFLQVFEDGRLTDSVGRVIDFTDTIVIATSNAGTAYVQKEIVAGKGMDEIREALTHGELAQYYRPEFLNRFDAVVLFRSLERAEIKEIAKRMLNRVALDLYPKGIELSVENGALEALADAGFDPTFGARPMRRVIQDRVEDQLAQMILARKVKRRDTIVLGDGLKMKIEPHVSK
jgi:ATP-dependent Clp protease ATP-binding subunit ClpA